MIFILHAGDDRPGPSGSRCSPPSSSSRSKSQKNLSRPRASDAKMWRTERDDAGRHNSRSSSCHWARPYLFPTPDLAGGRFFAVHTHEHTRENAKHGRPGKKPARHETRRRFYYKSKVTTLGSVRRLVAPVAFQNTVQMRKKGLALFFDRRTRPSLAGPSWTVPPPERHTAELTHRAVIAHRRPRRRIARTSSPAGWRRRAQKAQ